MEGMFLAFLSLHLPGKASEKRNVGKCFLACIFVFSLCLFTHTHTHGYFFFTTISVFSIQVSFLQRSA